MEYLKVQREFAEDARRKLIREDALEREHEIVHEGDHVLFPLKKKIEVAGCETVEREGPLKTRKPRSLREALEGKLSDEDLANVPTSYNIVGDIAVLELDEKIMDKREVIAEALMDTFRNLKVVALKTEMVSGEYRTPTVEVIAGEKRTETLHREHGCLYKLDVSEAYFSPRLAAERRRVVDQMGRGEHLLVLFAGVGPYAILAAKDADAKVTAVELNPKAVEYMRWNVRKNRVDVDVVEGDAREVTPSLGKFDRIIMPLPKLADTFLNVAVEALNPNGIIHYYSFAHNTLEATGHLAEVLGAMGLRPDILDAVECGSYSPCLSRYCADFRVESL
ncbi:MAG: methyltransferase domain-containing protein [Candidatus Altiarchaeales archaeon]|nr:methyltransferase domain-containing protein [Candidatus Altiarchaeales archaeon]MBD3417184.1 methyltransferase domain-containing protein [Candidatus Altiarchaeales archaeon]